MAYAQLFKECHKLLEHSKDERNGKFRKQSATIADCRILQYVAIAVLVESFGIRSFRRQQIWQLDNTEVEVMSMGREFDVCTILCTCKCPYSRHRTWALIPLPDGFIRTEVQQKLSSCQRETGTRGNHCACISVTSQSADLPYTAVCEVIPMYSAQQQH
jgi:hypothetical protein